MNQWQSNVELLMIRKVLIYIHITRKKDKRKIRKLRKKDSIAKNIDTITESADISGENVS